MFLRFFTISLLVFGSKVLIGQSFLTQYYFEHNHTAQFLNPSRTGGSGWTMAPPLFGNLRLAESRNSKAFRGLLLRFNRNPIDKEYFLDNLEADNFNRVDYTIGLLHVGKQFKKNYFTFSINEEVVSDLIFPREAMLALESLQDLNIVNQSFQILNLSARAHQVRQYRFGWSREAIEGLRIGVAGSIYYGVSNIESGNSYAFIATKVDVVTGETDIKATGEYSLKTSGLNFYDGDPSLSKVFYGSGNYGFGIDIGAEYKLNDRWSFSGSVLNLINSMYWNNYTENYNSEYVDLEVDPEEIWEKFQTDPGQFIDILPEVIDSLSGMLQTEVNDQAYVTRKPIHIFLGAEYTWNENWSSSLAQQWTITNQRADLFIRYGMKRKLGNILLHSSLGLYGESRNSVNLGLGMEYTTNNFNISLLTENAMAIFWASHNFNPSILLSVNFYLAKKELSTN
ncbi:MAG TPA: hypothetical protein DDX92_08800 [Flavobacteriales bacterium]|jgi:hypothetical protein|nr:hypothetical protein [Flavobacteriales bacterium]